MRFESSVISYGSQAFTLESPAFAMVCGNVTIRDTVKWLCFYMSCDILSLGVYACEFARRTIKKKQELMIKAFDKIIKAEDKENMLLKEMMLEMYNRKILGGQDETE